MAMKYWRRKKKGKEKEEEPSELFLKNGNKFFEELIKDCNGISNPIRMFSYYQISMAKKITKGSLSGHGFTCYKGVIEGRPYTIKKSLDSIVKFELSPPRHFGTDPCIYEDYQEQNLYDLASYKGDCLIEGRSYAIEKLKESLQNRVRVYYNDIVLSAKVSNHSGFLKLIGCCLEFRSPVLVFEHIEYGALNNRGSVGPEDGPLLPWNVRLKIAKEVAIAVTYLHTAFPRIIIHRYINPLNVFLDKNWKAKLTGFSSSVALPEGKASIQDIPIGAPGYLDPNYYFTHLVTEYTDVFSFGIFMLVLLMGRPAVLGGSDGRQEFDNEILNYVNYRWKRGEHVEFGGDSNDMKLGQMNKFLELALRCCEKRNEDRPKMILVAKELKLIERSLDS